MSNGRASRPCSLTTNCRLSDSRVKEPVVKPVLFSPAGHLWLAGDRVLDQAVSDQAAVGGHLPVSGLPLQEERVKRGEREKPKQGYDPRSSGAALVVQCSTGGRTCNAVPAGKKKTRLFRRFLDRCRDTL